MASNLASRGPLRDGLGRLFRGYCRSHLGVTIERGMGEFRAMSRQAVNALLQVRVQNRYLRVLTSSLGYGQGRLAYATLERASDGSEFANSVSPRFKVEYQPTVPLFFRVITEYQSTSRAELRDPELAHRANKHRARRRIGPAAERDDVAARAALPHVVEKRQRLVLPPRQCGGA